MFTLQINASDTLSSFMTLARQRITRGICSIIPTHRHGDENFFLFLNKNKNNNSSTEKNVKKQLRVIRDNKGKSISHRRLTRHLLSVWIVLCVWPFAPEIPVESWRTLSESVWEQHTFAVFALATWATSPKRSVRFLIASVKAGVDGADFPFWFFFEGGYNRQREIELTDRLDLTVDGVTTPKRPIRFCLVSSSTVEVGVSTWKRSARVFFFSCSSSLKRRWREKSNPSSDSSLTAELGRVPNLSKRRFLAVPSTGS